MDFEPNLTDEQEGILKQFQEIAQFEDTEMAVVTLASLDWNLENALEAHLGGNPVPARVGISREDYVDFDEEMAQELAREPEMPQMPEGMARFMRQMGADVGGARAPLAPLVPGPRAPMRAGGNRSPPEETSPPSLGSDRREERAGAGASSRTCTSNSTTSPSAAAAAAARTPAAAAASAASAANMDSDVSDDDDYDYAMSHDGDEDEDMPAASNGRAGGAANGGPSDFSIPLIPTDCNSAIEGTQNFQSVFEARHSKNGAAGHLMPPFFIGTLGGAIREAFECPDRPVCERRPLALYISHDRSLSKSLFPEVILLNEQVLQLLRSQFILWPWDVTAKENEEKLTQWLTETGLYDARPVVASFLNRVDKFPMLILLSKEGSQLRLCEVVDSLSSPDQAVGKLLSTMESYASCKVALEKQEAERHEREALRREQERELAESLAVDREKAERQAREIREAKEAEERIIREREEKEMKIAMLKASLPEEPAEGAPDCCAVRFRLPEQRQAVRRFTKSTPLSVLLTFLESEGFPVKEYRMMNSDFPVKKDISGWDHSKTLEEVKMPAREVINVEERPDE